MSGWSFCSNCGWHSSGKVALCPNCESKDVHYFADDLLMDSKGKFSIREEKGRWHSTDAAKGKEGRG